MKISELISGLKSLKEEHGDLVVEAFTCTGNSDEIELIELVERSRKECDGSHVVTKILFIS